LHQSRTTHFIDAYPYCLLDYFRGGSSSDETAFNELVRTHAVETLTPGATQLTGNAAVQTWRLQAESLRGQTLRIAGLETIVTDTLVRIAFLDGSTWVERLTPQQPGSIIPARPSAWGGSPYLHGARR
jgi:hypothetical protein